VARLPGNDVSAGPAGPGRILDAVRLLLPRFIRLCSSALSLVFFFFAMVHLLVVPHIYGNLPDKYC
jgi:hypothetical protein